MPERPDRMYRRGRPIVPCDDGVEPLYRRFTKDQMIDGKIEGLCFRFPDCSVNRGGEGFGLPEDVIFGLPDWGILKFCVHDVLPTVCADTPNAPSFALKVEHVPEEEEGKENYAHCEIRVYQPDPKNQQLIHRNKELPDGAKKVWRREMSKRVNKRPDCIYKHPTC